MLISTVNRPGREGSGRLKGELEIAPMFHTQPALVWRQKVLVRSKDWTRPRRGPFVGLKSLATEYSRLSRTPLSGRLRQVRPKPLAARSKGRTRNKGPGELLHPPSVRGSGLVRFGALAAGPALVRLAVGNGQLIAATGR